MARVFAKQISSARGRVFAVPKKEPEKLLPEKILEPALEVAKGAGKGVLSTIQGLSTLGQKALGAIGEKIGLQKKPIVELPKELTEAKGTAQEIGKGAEQLLEFFIPASKFATLGKLAEAGIAGSKLAKGGKVAQTAAKGLQLATKAGIGAGEFAGVTAVQTGDDKEAIKEAAVLGAAFPVAGEVLGTVVKKLAPKVAMKLEEINLRMTPVQKDKFSAKIGDIKQLILDKKITGNPQVRYDKINALYNNTEKILQDFLETNNTAKGIYVDKNTIISELRNLARTLPKDKADAPQIIKQIANAIKNVNRQYRTYKIPIQRLNTLKRDTYASAYNRAGDKVLNWVEHDIGDVYKTAIERATEGLTVNGKAIEAFNKEYGTIINARKLLKVARTRPQIGFVGRLVSSFLGATSGGLGGGMVGGAIGAYSAPKIAETVAGTAVRSRLASALNKISKATNLTKQESNNITNFILGGEVTLTQREKKIAKKISEFIDKPKIGLSLEDVSKNPLLSEARKYKTAEEFVKAQGTPMYHGSNKEIKKFKIRASGDLGAGAYFTPYYTDAQKFAWGKAYTQGGKQVINEVYLNYKNPLILGKGADGQLALDLFRKNNTQAITNLAKEKGYDAIIRDYVGDIGSEIAVLDENVIKTKSQLTDIWKEAHKK